jgi:hypothetical protein
MDVTDGDECHGQETPQAALGAHRGVLVLAVPPAAQEGRAGAAVVVCGPPPGRAERDEGDVGGHLRRRHSHAGRSREGALLGTGVHEEGGERGRVA